MIFSPTVAAQICNASRSAVCSLAMSSAVRGCSADVRFPALLDGASLVLVSSAAMSADGTRLLTGLPPGFGSFAPLAFALEFCEGVFGHGRSNTSGC